jgi:hypothetical protein
MSERTIRGIVRLIQVEIQDTPDLLPDRAAELLNKLSAILGNINDQIREADLAYSNVLLVHLESEEKANRAKIRAETTPEFIKKREARDTRELAIELIRSLKYYLNAKRDEFRYSGAQQ